MKKIRLLITGLILVIISACSDQRNKPVTLKLSETTKEQRQKDFEEGSIKGIMVHTVTLLRDHNVDVNNDRCFAEMMMYYNHAAIDISEVLLKESRNAALIRFAKERLGERSDEMNGMSLFLQREPEQKSSTSKDFQTAVTSAILKMNMATNFKDSNVDTLFVMSTITLQRCAIDMAEAEIMFGSRQTLKTHARKIVSSGQEEIEWMREWLKKN